MVKGFLSSTQGTLILWQNMESVWRDIFLRAFVALGNVFHHYSKMSLFDVHVCKSTGSDNCPFVFVVTVSQWWFFLENCAELQGVCVYMLNVYMESGQCHQEKGSGGWVHRWSKISLTHHPWFSRAPTMPKPCYLVLQRYCPTFRDTAIFEC